MKGKATEVQYVQPQYPQSACQCALSLGLGNGEPAEESLTGTSSLPQFQQQHRGTTGWVRHHAQVEHPALQEGSLPTELKCLSN